MREEALESVSDKELTDTCSEMQSNELKTDIHGPRRRFTFLRRRENKEGKDKEKERAKFSIEGSYHLARPVRTVRILLLQHLCMYVLLSCPCCM
jgi:hypothetical protein